MSVSDTSVAVRNVGMGNDSCLSIKLLLLLLLLVVVVVIVIVVVAAVVQGC